MTMTDRIQGANSLKEIMDIVVNLPHDKDHDRYVLLAFLRYDEIKKAEVQKKYERT